MGDVNQRRKVRTILSALLGNYYEMLMELARRESRERWERLMRLEEDHRVQKY
jgi:hypothetical protein